MKHSISKAALDDLMSIWLYGAEEWGARQADAYNDRFKEVFLMLEDFPELGTQSEVLGTGWRIHPVGNHLVVYRVRQEVEIVRILHQRQDRLSILRE